METHPNVVSSVIDEPSYKVRYTQKSEIRPGGYRIISPIDSKEFYKPDEIITFIIGENLLNHQVVDIFRSYIVFENVNIHTNKASADLDTDPIKSKDPFQYESYVPDSMLSMFEQVTFPEIRGFDTPDRYHYGYDKKFIDSLASDYIHNSRFTEALSQRYYGDEVSSTIKVNSPFGVQEEKKDGAWSYPDRFPLTPAVQTFNQNAATEAELTAERKGLRLYGDIGVRLHVGLQKEVYHLRDNVRTLKMSGGQMAINLQDLLPFSFRDINGHKQHLKRNLKITIRLSRPSKCLRPAQLNIWISDQVGNIGKSGQLKSLDGTTTDKLTGSQRTMDHNLAAFKFGKTGAGADEAVLGLVRKLWNPNLSYTVHKPRLVQYRIALNDESTQYKMKILRSSLDGFKYVGTKVNHYSWPLQIGSNYQQFTKTLTDGPSVSSLIFYIGPRESSSLENIPIMTAPSFAQLRHMQQQGVNGQTDNYLSFLAGLLQKKGSIVPAKHSYPLEHNWRFNFPFNEYNLKPYVKKKNVSLRVGGHQIIEPHYSEEIQKRITANFLSGHRQMEISTLIDNPEYYSNNHFFAVNLLQDPTKVFSGPVVNKAGGLTVDYSFDFVQNEASYTVNDGDALAAKDFTIARPETMWGIRTGSSKTKGNHTFVDGDDDDAKQESSSQQAAYDFKENHWMHMLVMTPVVIRHYETKIVAEI